MTSFHFESINKITPKYEFSNKQIGLWTLDFEHHYALEDTTKINQCMQKLKHERNIKGN